ncbi:2-keto-4-pentenoate hydratase [Bordetella bronchialis]|uniref:2-keto-4-pentenoate hydratase n=1 Tax=Bordetella bronchialis TaxID=463025 RepID=UPI0009F3F88B|nr:fumarylacetoacetate hydrolase family protein [Bordetella bronchialis]
MTDVFDPAPAAALLAQAWQEGRQLSEIPEDIRPRNLTEGYALQDAFIKTYADRTGDRGAGWKLGVGSAAAMQAAGTDRPLVGRVLAGHRYDDGATVRVLCQAPITVEFEIAFVLGRDISPGAAPADPMQAVASTHIAFELVLSRFINRRAVGWPSFVGDSVGFEASILGPQIDAAAIQRGVASVAVEANGQAMGGGLSGDDGIEPVQMLRYLFEHACYHGLTLRAGDVVTTGAVAQPFDIAPGKTTLGARFLGRTLTAQVVPAQD